MNRSKYRKAFCEKLVEHLGRGLTLISFGAEVGVGRKTLYNWLEKYPAFAEAYDQGWSKREAYMLNMGHMLTTGQMRRLVSEEPVLTSDGNVVYGKDGKPILKKTYAQVRGEPAIWIFLMKNWDWRDRKDVQHTGGDPSQGDKPVSIETNRTASTDADVERRYNELLAKATAK
jgi:hypothetical protein